MIPAKDISRWQGAWQDTGEPIVMIKMSGGDAGLYFDPDAGTNYTDAKAAGKHVGGYHFIGWSAGAAQEASWFLKAMAPLVENDVYALDAEAIPGGIDPVGYVLAMANYIHGAIGVWPLVYMNLSTLNSYNWDPVLANSGLWLADWAVSPNATIPTQHTYVMQQYSDGPAYDHDEWFGTLVEFDAYGWHQAAPPPPPPVPTPAPVPDPKPPTPTPTPIPPDPTPEPTPQPQPVPPTPPSPVPPVPVKSSPIQAFITALVKWLKALVGLS